MGIIVLLAVGCVLGWLASILVCADSRQGVLGNVAVGIVGAQVIGWLANSSSLLVNLTASALLIAFIGTILLLAGYNLLRRAVTRQLR